MFAHEVVTPGTFVNVVAQMENEIEILLGHVLIRRVVTCFKVLARRNGKAQPIHPRPSGGKRSGAADRAHGIAGAELIPVPAVRLKAGHLDVHRMGPLGRRGDLPRLHDLRQAIIGRDLPLHFDGPSRHPTAVQRIDGETGPQDDAVGAGVAGTDAQRKWRRREFRILKRGAGGKQLSRRCAVYREPAEEKRTAIQHARPPGDVKDDRESLRPDDSGVKCL